MESIASVGPEGRRMAYDDKAHARALEEAARRSREPAAQGDPLEEPTGTATVRRVRSNDAETKARALSVHQTLAVCSPTQASTLQRDGFLRLVSSQEFEFVVAVVIVANAVFLGLECNYYATRLHRVKSVEYLAVGVVFTVLYLSELCFRILAEGRRFLCSKQAAVNVFDVLIVVAAIIESCLDLSELAGMSPVYEGGGASDMFIGYLRVARLARVLRLYKMIRYVKALKTLVNSILYTLRSLVWAILLLVLVVYIYAIMITSSATSFLSKAKAEWHESIADDARTVERYWATVELSMFTLFKAVTNGLSWELAADPLGRVMPVSFWLFNTYIVFAFFSVLNVVTGVFCQSAIEAAQQDRDLMIQNHMLCRERYVVQASSLFECLDDDGEGTITVAEFEGAFHRPDVQAFFHNLGVESSDAWALFKLIDSEGDHIIGVEEFIDGCLRLKGPAKSIDMVKLLRDQHQLVVWLLDFMDFTESELSKVSSAIGKPHAAHRSPSATPAPLLVRSQTRSTPGGRLRYGRTRTMTTNLRTSAGEDPPNGKSTPVGLPNFEEEEEEQEEELVQTEEGENSGATVRSEEREDSMASVRFSPSTVFP